MKATEPRRMAKRVLEKRPQGNRELFIVFGEEESHRAEAETPNRLIVLIKRFGNHERNAS